MLENLKNMKIEDVMLRHQQLALEHINYALMDQTQVPENVAERREQIYQEIEELRKIEQEWRANL